MSDAQEITRLRLGTVDVDDDDLEAIARFYTLNCRLAPLSLAVKYVREYGINSLDDLESKRSIEAGP